MKITVKIIIIFYKMFKSSFLIFLTQIIKPNDYTSESRNLIKYIKNELLVFKNEVYFLNKSIYYYSSLFEYVFTQCKLL